ncbi:MAG: tRNA (adenosine(37)-N6)-threonylcarbamoyltransferase complex dimerization subunit type 1 TsaB [Ruminococcaceae bacterium]|nr:tRNA (adenosine(37)-N6)-threonylcarbamoyltransferase complex dimerization subunit type 1 TsaB [Oscillospiraceae bacterium]
MIVLGLDASSDSAAVGIVKDGVLLCEQTIHNGKNHSLTLLPAVETLLGEVGLSFENIDVYACGIGPGSFTGVRIGAATLKGFAQAWDKPVVALSSLQILAENIRDFDGLRVSAIHARTDELFCAAYDADGNEVMAPQVMTIAEFLEALKGKNCKIVGNGAAVFAGEMEEVLGKDSLAHAGWTHIIRGGAVAELGYQFASGGKTISCAELAPSYLRVSQAEREYQEKQHN